MAWQVRPNRNGRINRVCIEPDGSDTPGFYLYTKQALESPAFL